MFLEITNFKGFPTTYNTDSYVARCYDKLETALDTMLKMNQKRMSRGETIVPNVSSMCT